MAVDNLTAPKSIGEITDSLFDALALLDCAQSLSDAREEGPGSSSVARALRVAWDLIEKQIKYLGEVDLAIDNGTYHDQ